MIVVKFFRVSLFFSFVFIFCFISKAGAIYVNATSGSKADIEAALAQVVAAGSGTIHIPAGHFEWGDGYNCVEMPGGVSLVGEGRDKTFLHQSEFMFNRESDKPGSFTISDIAFIGYPQGATGDSGSGGIAIRNIVDFRIHHCLFEGLPGSVQVQSREGLPQARGVIDHCIMTNGTSSNSTPYGFTSGPSYWPLGESRLKNAGTAEALFVEDCYIDFNTESDNHPMAGFNGGHYVIRHSTIVNSGQLDGHGAYGYEFYPLPTDQTHNRGFRCMEVYSNVFLGDPTFLQTPVIPRAGGGIVWNNYAENFAHLAIFVINSSTGVDNPGGDYLGTTFNWDGISYPAPDQIHDFYIWDNTVVNITEELILIDYPDLVQENRDYFLSAPTLGRDGFTWTPFPYPHYLVSGDTPPVTYALTTAVSPTGAGTVSGGGSHTAGTSVSVTATANTGYTFTSWTGDATGATSPVTVVMSSSKTVTATFSTAITYTLTAAISPTGGGTVALNPTGVPAGTYTAGTTVTVTATPSSSYVFTSWTGAASGATSPVTVTVSSNKTVTATFTYVPPGYYALTTAVSPTGGGTIMLNPTGGSYASGTTVTATAIAATGYLFTSWTGDASGTSSPVTVTMNSNKTVTATFISPGSGYALTTVVSPTGGGIITLSPTGGGYASGTTVTVTATATAATGYTFTSWTGDATGTTSPVTVTMNANKTVTATFATAATYTLTTAVSPAGGGTITLSPPGVPTGSYTAGTTVIVTATAVSGYTFTSWTGSATGTTNPATVTVDADKSVTATFSAIEGPLIPVEITAYPNPFIPSENTNLKFKGTSAEDAEVRIYSMTGELVRAILKEERTSGDISWDGNNEAGEKVESGIYIYVVTGGENRFSGRIAVIR